RHDRGHQGHPDADRGRPLPAAPGDRRLRRAARRGAEPGRQARGQDHLRREASRGRYHPGPRHRRGDEQLLPIVRDRPHPLGRARLPCAGRPVQVVPRPRAHSPGGAAGADRRAYHALVDGHDAQHHVPHGGSDDGRRRGLQQHPHRRIHAPADCRWHAAQGGRAVRGPGSPAPDPHDIARDHNRPDPDGPRPGRGKRVVLPARALDHRRDDRLRRPDGLHRAVGLLPGLPRPRAGSPGQRGGRQGHGTQAVSRLILLSLACSLLACRAGAAGAPAPEPLSLEEARATALRNHPQYAAAQLKILLSKEMLKEAQAGYYPVANGYVTAVGANAENTRILAGTLNNPSIYDRFAEGVAVSQLITDFGRTGSLASGAKYETRAATEGEEAAREQILLNAEANYYAVLKAQSVIDVA